MHGCSSLSKQQRRSAKRCFRLLVLGLAITGILGGCQSLSDHGNPATELASQTFSLESITPERAQSLLLQVGLGVVALSAEPNALRVTAAPPALLKVRAILDVIDVNEPCVVEILAPASAVRTLPSNDQIAQAIGNLAIGTFSEVPKTPWQARAIIDVVGNRVVAIVPQRLWPDVRAVVEQRGETFRLATDRRPTPANQLAQMSRIAESQSTSSAPLLIH